MAGHPTIGSTFALAAEGAHRAGPPRVRLRARRRADARLARMGRWRAVVRVDDAAAAGVRRDRRGPCGVCGCRRARRIGSCGRTPGPVRVVRRAVSVRTDCVAPRGGQRRDRSARAGEELWASGARRAARLLFHDRAGEPAPPVRARAPETVYSRMLAPGYGIAEDPATGGASGPLGCYLVQHLVVSPEAARSMLSLQGVAMGRPSRIYMSIEGRPGAFTRVRVGGRSVLVGRGELQI